MDIPFIATLLDQLREVPLSTISFIWHGGEPLLLGVGFFRKVNFLQKHLLHGRKTIRNILQTNGTLVTSEWASHLAAYQYSVGVSLDGPKHIHNEKRHSKTVPSTWDSCVGAIDLLKSSGIPVGVLTVVSDALLEYGPSNLMRDFRNLAVDQYALLSLRKRWPDSSSALRYNRNFGQFMAEAASIWLREDDLNTGIRELDSRIDVFFGLGSRVCKDRGQCVGGYFGVESDGSVWHCDKFMKDDRFFLGNLLDQPFVEIQSPKNTADLKRIEVEVREKCRPCDWFHLCKGGCLFDLMYFHEIGGKPGTRDCVNYSLFEVLSHFLAENLELKEIADLPHSLSC